MKLSDFNRLRKMMSLTFSESDGECLNAVRAANAILKRSGVDWDKVFNRLVTAEVEEGPDEAPEPEPPSHERKRKIEAAFALLEGADDITPGFRKFVGSLRAQWRARHWLSPDQITALLQAAQREREKC